MPNFLSLSSANAAFVAYAITTVILCLNMMVLWVMSGGARGKAKVTPNPEDAVTVSKGAAVNLSEPEAVARVLRAHRNAADNITPFLFLGLVYVILGAPALVAQILFGSFAAARLLHSIVYLAGKQPWRTIFYFVSILPMLGLVVEIIRMLAR